MMWLKYALFVIAALLLVLAAVVRINGYRQDNAIRQMWKNLKIASAGQTEGVFHYRDLAGLPEPLQRFFRKVLPEGQPIIRFVELRQTGFMRLDEKNGKWLPLRARQYFSTHPPGFLWDARVRMAPLVTARVLDSYRNGAGSLRARLFNTFTVADESGTGQMAAAELVRYLAEAVWFPTALLPGPFLKWEAIDDHTARARLHDGHTEVHLTFYFNEKDEIEKATTSRAYQVKGRFQTAPWTGYYRDYRKRNGILIPLRAKVVWTLPAGDFEYWQGQITDIRYEF